MNDKSGQLFITASQKNRFILDALVELYGGTIYPMVKVGAFKWTCFRKDEVLSLVNTYFKANPCRSEKKVRLNMANKFYELRALHAHKATPDSVLGKVWTNFTVKWDKVYLNKFYNWISNIYWVFFFSWQRDGPFSLNWIVSWNGLCNDVYRCIRICCLKSSHVFSRFRWIAFFILYIKK